MNIELIFDKNLKDGYAFRIPINSEADDFLSGIVFLHIIDNSLQIVTNCMGAEGNILYCLDIIHLVMNNIYLKETGKNISDAR